MRAPLRRDRRNLGRPESARFHRDAAAGGGVGTSRHAVLAGAARRQREPERRADALADCERAVAAQRARSARSGAGRVGRRTVPGARVCRQAGGASPMKRIASIWLPPLAIERWAKCERLTRLTRRSSSPSRARTGFHPCGDESRRGTRRAARRAADRRPRARSGPDRGSRRSRGDQALLRRFAKWAGRWSPLVEVDGGDALRLDVSGVAHLFGGEDGLADDIRTRFARAGFTVRVAIAPTTAAAWALARYQPLSPPRERESSPRSGGRVRGWRVRPRPLIPLSFAAPSSPSGERDLASSPPSTSPRFASIPTRCGRSNGLA